jgi:hypothetical protein
MLVEPFAHLLVRAVPIWMQLYERPAVSQHFPERNVGRWPTPRLEWTQAPQGSRAHAAEYAHASAETPAGTAGGTRPRMTRGV